MVSRSQSYGQKEKHVLGRWKNMCGDLEVEKKNLVCIRAKKSKCMEQLGFLWALKPLCFLLSVCISHCGIIFYLRVHLFYRIDILKLVAGSIFSVNSCCLLQTLIHCGYSVNI